jgi:hypothetical protein
MTAVTVFLEIDIDQDNTEDAFPAIQAAIENHMQNQRGWTCERAAWRYGLIDDLPLDSGAGEPFAMPPVLRVGSVNHNRIITDVLDYDFREGKFKVRLDDTDDVQTIDACNWPLHYAPLMSWLKRKRRAILGNIYAEAFETGYQHMKNGQIPDHSPVIVHGYAVKAAQAAHYTGSQISSGDEKLAFTNGIYDGARAYVDEVAQEMRHQQQIESKCNA